MEDSKSPSMASEKVTVVRVKRKRSHVPVESIWLEVTGRPIKRQELNLDGLSLDDAATKASGDEGLPAKLLFRRVDTLSPSDIKQFSVPEWLVSLKGRKRSRQKQEPRITRKSKEKQGQLLAAAKEQHEASSRVARFEQVWRSRRREGRVAEEDDALRELCHLYDVVRVDVEAESAAKVERRNQAKREAELREGQLLCNYLPLLREVLPSLVSEIDDAAESLSSPSATTTTEEYVYDVYTLDEDKDSEESATSYPTVQILAEEYDWREQHHDSDHDSEDSNDENNPNNDYPEEEDDLASDDLHEDSSSEFLDYVNPYGSDNEEYDTVLSDDERGIWGPRK